MPAATLDRHNTTTDEQLHLRAADGIARDEFAVEDGILPSPPRHEPRKERWANEFAASTEQPQESRREVGPLIRISCEGTPQRRLDLLQHWEGVVQEVAEDAVWAEIVDLTDRSNPSETVEIPFFEFAVADRPLLSPGCIFYWSIGYETSTGGTIRRVSEIRVRRTAAWSQRTVGSLKARAQKLCEQYTNGEIDPTTAG